MKHSQPLKDQKSTVAHLAVSVKTAAEMMQVSDQSVRRLVRRGLLKPSRALRVLRIPISQIEELLNR